MQNYILVVESKRLESILYCNQVPVLSIPCEFDGLTTYKLNGWLSSGDNQLTLVVNKIAQINDSHETSDSFVKGRLYTIGSQAIEAGAAEIVVRYAWTNKAKTSLNSRQTLPFTDQIVFSIDDVDAPAWNDFSIIRELNADDKKNIIQLARIYFRALLDNDRSKLKELLKIKAARLKQHCYRDPIEELQQLEVLPTLERNQIACLAQLKPHHFRYFSALNGKSIVVSGDLLTYMQQNVQYNSKQSKWAVWPLCFSKLGEDWVIVN